jgi:tripartite-type tricarboxylate transporter receptor subunit TctC
MNCKGLTSNVVSPTIRFLAPLLAVIALQAVAVKAEGWPERTITIVAPYAAGGNVDVASRIFARELSKRLGKDVVVDNKPGANGAIGMTYVANAKPDGYTLIITGTGPLIFSKMIHKSMTYDPDTQFTPIIMTTELPHVLAANPKLPVNNVKELLAYAKQKDGGLTIGHGGIGGTGHLAGVMFMKETGVKGVLVGYRGTGPLVTDLIGGQIDVGFPAYIPQVSQTKPIAVTSAKRSRFLPNVPTLRESGVDLVATLWNGMLGPAGMPKDIVMKINAAMNDILKDPAVQKDLIKLGAEPLGGSPEDFAKLLADEKKVWGPVVRDANIRDK